MKVHFIGIGGIGVSALARYYLAQGHQVSGSDLVSSEITDDLKKQGVKITIGRNFIKKEADLIIHTPAVKIKPGRIKTLSYPQALGEITRNHFTIAVAGTHGKSTTVTMLGILLVKAGLDPTVIVGTRVREFGNSNCRIGKSKYLLIEADEHFKSFLNYSPKIIIITCLESDHLDYYKNFKNLKKAFKNFVSLLPREGLLLDMRKISFSLADKKKVKNLLKVPGEHNVNNGLAALAVARALSVSDRISFKALSQFRGAWRRFETVSKNPLIISDYGHHPTEIRETLKAAREKWPKKEIWCVYQPHQYQRTGYLFKGFVKAFREAPVDKLIVTDIFDVAGRERKIKKINSKKLVDETRKENVIYQPKKTLKSYLKKKLPARSVLIVMGAGDIYKLVNVSGHRGGWGDWVSPRVGKD